MHVMGSTIISISLAMAAPATATPAFDGETPVTEAILARVRGTALVQRSLVSVTTEQSVAQGQLVSETMRGILENWFADNNVQLIANATTSRF